MMMRRTYYDILGVGRNATNDDVKRAYRKLAKLYHPDFYPDPQEKKDAAKLFQETTTAYNVLNDDIKRRHYDRLLGLSRQPTAESKNLNDLSAAMVGVRGLGDNTNVQRWIERIRGFLSAA